MSIHCSKHSRNFFKAHLKCTDCERELRMKKEIKKNLTFIKNENKLITEEFFGDHHMYRAEIDEENFVGEIYEVGSPHTRIVYHVSSDNLNNLKKNLKEKFKDYGVKFERQVRKKLE